MKSNLAPILRSTRTAGLSRAQFSPVVRGVTTTGATSSLHGFDAPATRATTLTPFWNPHVLDRLQPPLTRFRD
jgi:hypothetical protein